jgi:lysophospholipase L1-like esterase
LEAGKGDSLAWHDIRNWGVEGKGWGETERFYDRLPARAKGKVRPPVWDLSRHSAGMAVRFESDATTISAHWTLLSNGLAMSHMPASGVSGLDLYAQDERGCWRWLGVGRPEAAPRAQAQLIAGLPAGRRAFMLYLPLYNGVESVEIGLDPQAVVKPLPPRRTKPIVFYGTSIVQGGCASRPGMAYTAILGRRLDRAVINLGFSGNGPMDLEVAELMAELEPCVYVIDALPNMSLEQVAERTEPFVRALRTARPVTPVALVEDRTWTNAALLPAHRQHHAAMRAALNAAVATLTAAGVQGLHVAPGEPLLGDDGEATVDGSHPTDLGFARMADALEPVLKPLV